MSPGLGHDPPPSYNITALGNTALCLWQQPQHILFQLANFCFALSYSAPSSRKGILFMHSVLIIGFMLLSGWAWHVICAPDIFSWNFSFLLLNIGQLVYIVYQMMPVRFDSELQEAYHTLFYPFKVRHSCPRVDSLNMEFFRSFLRVIGLLQPTKVDFISELPPEVSQLILRKLDPESLLSAAQVSPKWLEICSSDKVLRQSATRHKRRGERRHREELVGKRSPEHGRIVVPKKMRAARRSFRDPPCMRLEAAIVFANIQPPRNLTKHAKLKASLGVRCYC